MKLDLNIKLKNLDGTDVTEIKFDIEKFKQEHPQLWASYSIEKPQLSLAKIIAINLYNLAAKDDPIKLNDISQELYDKGCIDLDLTDFTKLEDIIKDMPFTNAAAGLIKKTFIKAKSQLELN